MSSESRPRSRVFPALDTLRALAAVAVLATHVSFWAGAYPLPVWGTALSRLDVGVAVFFVLSGFLLSHPWFEGHAHGLRAPGSGRYLWKRTLRIVPVYVLTVVAALTVLPDNRGAGADTWVSSLLLATIYVDDQLPAGLTQMWSLSTEVAFYLVLPALLWLTLSRRRDGAPSSPRIGTVVGGMAAVNVLWVMVLADRLDLDAMTRLWLPSYLIWFAVGLLLAACEVYSTHDRGTGPARLVAVAAELGRSPGLCWLAAGALFLVAATPLAGPADLTPTTLGAAMTKNLLYAGIAGLLVLPAVFARREGGFVRALSHPVGRHLGHISYGIFCVHLVVLELVARWRGIELFEGRGWELFALTLGLTLMVSEVLYRVVERPTMRLRHLPAPWSRAPRPADPREPTSAPSVTSTRS